MPIGLFHFCSWSPIHELWAPIICGYIVIKAERQKLRSEQQAAAQNSSKRSHIDFSKESTSVRSARGKDVARKSRFEPYGSGGHLYIDGKGKDLKERQKGR